MEIRGLNIVIAGGGTGGHLFPGVALADAFKDISEENNILFLNTGNRIEKKVLNDTGYSYEVIPSGGLLGKSIFMKIKSIMKILSSILLASGKLKNFNADAVIGVGGYVSAPVIAAAWLRGIPVFIQEQNTIPGLANRVFAKISKLNFTSFKNTSLGSHDKKLYTGNPIRKKIVKNRYEIEDRNKLKILITGGSQGSRAINRSVTDAFEFIGDIHRIRFIHQTGEKDYESVVNQYEKKSINGEVAPFFSNMDELYSKADLIIARAGASTISEIACAGLPALLIPFPFATHNHQYFNALSLTESGAAKLIEEKNLSGKVLADIINNIVKNPDILLSMSKKMEKNAKPNAAYDICSYIIGKLN